MMVVDPTAREAVTGVRPALSNTEDDTTSRVPVTDAAANLVIALLPAAVGCWNVLAVPAAEAGTVAVVLTLCDSNVTCCCCCLAVDGGAVPTSAILDG